ncbi:hypothetical protein [Pseudomonas sp. N040]|uniref:hypothetical protein n=1 Tax=Pseudomonas sp. N040 TaxID=2785325 RepID=UPI0018A33A3F|nr:hypothetical protein [Pseudomonas sp. N040]MBF7731370.1 hypothetical protein [Pseudomonas sp. N040]MBW7015013.1 hypothetical protein [Pseudomonas sp. N040]
MIGKMLSTGFSLATMPARLAFRSARAMAMTPAEFTQFMDELRGASDEAVREIQFLLASVDDEMERKTAHLSNEQKQQAALLALDAAEKHLSMAAVNILRAVWLALNSNPELPAARRGETIDQQR